MMERKYYCNDFDYDEYKNEIESSGSIQCFIDNEMKVNKTESESSESENWNIFYQKHKTGKFYKSRNYILYEFNKYFQALTLSSETGSTFILECGAGHGTTIYSLIDKLSDEIIFYATDYSEDALKILRENCLFDSSRVKVSQWDIIKPISIVLPCPPKLIICIFTLSAIHPDFHHKCFKNMADILESGSVICFRDYGQYDFTQFKQKSFISQNLYRRFDNTLSFYFTTEYLESIIEKLKDELEIIEISYCTILSKNRSTNVDMKRIYLHSVIKKK